MSVRVRGTKWWVVCGHDRAAGRRNRHEKTPSLSRSPAALRWGQTVSGIVEAWSGPAEGGTNA
jgi:hypothetical protein